MEILDISADNVRAYITIRLQPILRPTWYELSPMINMSMTSQELFCWSPCVLAKRCRYLVQVFLDGTLHRGAHSPSASAKKTTLSPSRNLAPEEEELQEMTAYQE